MRGRHGQQRAARERLQHGTRERGSLDGISAGGDLVEQHDRPAIGDLEDLDEVADVAREGREAALDRLLVADVGEHVGDDRQHRALGRHLQPGLVQQHAERERLQRDGLAAGVRAAQDNGAHVFEVEVDADDAARVEQRVTGADERDVAGDLGCDAVPRARQLGAREGEVDQGERLDRCDEIVGLAADDARELDQDALHLVALVPLELALLVRQLDELERLDEDRLPASRAVVHDPAHGAARRGLDGQHGPAVALGHELLLQVRCELGRRGELAQALGGAPAHAHELAAERLQARRGRVAQLRVVEVDRPGDPLGDGGETVGDRLGVRREQPRVVVLRRDRRAHAERGRARLGDRGERRLAEHAAMAGVLRLLAHVVRAREPRWRALDQPPRLDRLGLQQVDGRGLRHRREAERELAARAERRALGEPLADRGELQDVEGVPVHR